MFYYISYIISIDFSKFDASSVTEMSEMFKECKNLQSIVFNGINTSSVTTMYKMFTSCSSLKYLDLSDFDTSKTRDMTSMFEECYELISLDLSSFNMSLVTTIEFIFSSCTSLKYLDLRNFVIQKDTYISSTFNNCDDLIFYCINMTNNELIKNEFPKWSINNCSFFKTKKTSENNGVYETVFPEKEENNNIITTELTNIENSYTFYIGQNLNNSKNDSENYTNNISLSYNISEEFYQKYNDSLNNNSSIESYKNQEGYYLDNNISKPCYSLCKKCIKEGDKINNNCIQCVLNYTLIGSNCYKSCSYYFYFDNSNNYFCTLSKKCPDDYKNLIKEKNQCIDNCQKDNIYINEYNNTCYKSNPNVTYKEESRNEYILTEIFFNNSYKYNKSEILIENIKNGLINGSINISKVLGIEKKDISINDNNILYQITSSDNQKNIKNDNISNILLGKCEDILKRYYDIKEDQSLLIFKIDYYQPVQPFLL